MNLNVARTSETKCGGSTSGDVDNFCRIEASSSCSHISTAGKGIFRRVKNGIRQVRESEFDRRVQQEEEGQSGRVDVYEKILHSPLKG